MSKKKTFLGLGLVAALAVPAIAAAWPEGDGPRAKMVEKFDANHDGKLDDTERAAMRQEFEARHAERKAEMLAKFDANKDGTLDDAERTQMRKTFATERFQKLDTNKDGALSLDEFTAGAEMMGPHRGFGHRFFGGGHGDGERK